MEDIKEYYHQLKNIEYLKNTYGKEMWVQIAGNKVINNSNAGLWSALIDVNNIDYAQSHISWDSHKGTQEPGFEMSGDEVTYYSKLYSSYGIENIVNLRNFYDIKPSYAELVEEFVLLNNLYFDRQANKYYFIKDNGECEEVARIEDNTNVFMNLKYLIKYATAKQMAILLFFDIRVNINGRLYENNLSAFKDSYSDCGLLYDIWGDDMTITNACYSILMGKK